MERILFYYPSNKRSVQIETTLIELKKAGYEILFLTTCEEGDIHQELKDNGISTFTNNIKSSNSVVYYLKQLSHFISFCKDKQVDIVFSNLQHTNFIAAFGQYFVPSKIIAFRHHFKFNQGNYGVPLKINKNEALFDKVINLISKKIVVPSKGVYNGILNFEKVKKHKLEIIPYMYDFSKYGTPNQENVNSIKKEYKAKLRIIMVARLIPFKRHILIFPIFKKLIEAGYDIQVLILDEGPEKENLQNWISTNKMEDRIHLLGFQRKFLDFMMASDLLIHPSLTEASNNVVKEIGLLKKAVAVCQGVGDFDDYIVEGQNGFFLDIEKPEVQAEKVIIELYNEPSKIEVLGNNLNKTILKQFNSNEPVLKQYKELINKL